MSKYVKNLISEHLHEQFVGIEDALLVNVIGLGAPETTALRAELRSKNIQLMVVKNSLVRRALEGQPLGEAFAEAEGPLAVVWGAEDVVTLAKEVIRLAEQPEYEAFDPRGGTMEGSVLTREQVKEVSKWPSRDEQLSLLLGQILSPGAKLASQLIAPGGALGSQIEQKSKESTES